MSIGYWVYQVGEDGDEEKRDEFNNKADAVKWAIKLREEFKYKTLVKEVEYERTHVVDPNDIHEEDYGELYVYNEDIVEVFE